MQTFTNSMLFIACSSFLSLYGAYYLEVFTRKDYLAAKTLGHLNNNLDQLARKKTMELEDEKQKNIRMLLEGQERERERIASELHDSICNQLALLSHDLEMQTEISDFSTIGRSIANIKEVCREVRHLSQNQSAHVLKRYGLAKAMEELINNIGNKYQIKISANFFGAEKPLPEYFQINLYRCFQEALHNVIKHAGASHIDIQLIHHGKSIDLTISDNGKGFIPENYSGMGHGLGNMKLRIEKQLEGTISIDSAPGKGTTIIISVNLNHHD